MTNVHEFTAQPEAQIAQAERAPRCAAASRRQTARDHGPRLSHRLRAGLALGARRRRLPLNRRAFLGTPSASIVGVNIHAPRRREPQHCSIAMFDVARWDDLEPTADSAVDDADLETLLRRVELGREPAPAASSARPNGSGKARGASCAHSAAVAAPLVAAEPCVELGFVSTCPAGYATPELFPSKVGGAPVWLDPRRPAAEALACRKCSRPLRHLLQLYCPRPELPHAYHRSLLVFCCGGDCLRTPAGWRALRCVLPADTPLYVEQPDGSYKYAPASVLHASGSGEQQAAGGANAADGRTPSLLPELMISIGVEGDWASHLHLHQAEGAALAAAAEARYRDRMLGDGAAAGSGEPGGSDCREAAGAESDSGADEDLEDVDTTLIAFQERISVWPEQVSYSHHHTPAKIAGRTAVHGPSSSLVSRTAPPAGLPASAEALHPCLRAVAKARPRRAACWLQMLGCPARFTGAEILPRTGLSAPLDGSARHDGGRTAVRQLRRAALVRVSDRAQSPGRNREGGRGGRSAAGSRGWPRPGGS